MANPLCPAPTITVVVRRTAVSRPDQETVTVTAVGLVRTS
jgi:hypothetical protein